MENLKYERFRNSNSEQVTNYFDLLAAGWVRDHHLYTDHPLAFFFDPQEETLHYEPCLPESAYTPEELSQLISEFEFNSKEVSLNYLKSLLRTSLFIPLSEEFYGKVTDFRYETIDENSEGFVFNKKPILVEELILHFKQEGLTEPWKGTLLNKIQIQSLLKAKDQKLNQLIFSILEKNWDKADEIDLIINLYRGNSEAIQELLLIFLELGMIMRGWIQSNPYPLRKIDKKSIDHELKTQLLGAQIRELNDQLEMFPEIGNLPLMLFKNGQFRYSNRTEDGLSLKDRLNIVLERKGEESCTRVSSNWFISSSYYYLCYLGYEHNFQIDELELLYD